ncbi:hypothetical protein CG716_13625 [Mycolicibacterium sphagni]|uniref:AbiTii domain-containing protein n=1 Tax=Mycolicibacterium sphagni TaxID=1786 RepID=A0A255DTC4_9MYCO|nr:hypothetical protein CG716_13625 [Mycolicibacterium sphagni]
MDNELSGYPSDAAIPDYRGPFPCQVLSDWSGPFQSGAQNVPLPSVSVPKGMREAGAFEVRFHESVSQLEQFASAGDTVVYSWGADAVAILNTLMNNGTIPQIMEGYGLLVARKHVPAPLIVEVLDNVRTRVLNLALELEKVTPDAGEPGTVPADQSTVNNIVNIIYGHGNTLAVDSPSAVQVGGVRVNDLDSLLNSVAGLGLAPEDVSELQQAVEGDEADDETPAGEPGSRVTRFLGKLTVGALKSAGQAGVQEGAKAISKAILTYYGIN